MLFLESKVFPLKLWLTKILLVVNKTTRSLIFCLNSLKKLQVPNTDVMLYCDISTHVIHLCIPKTHRYQVFRNLHELAHPGVRATVRLICSRFVWPKMKHNIVNFTRSCIACQKSKIFHHVHSPLAEFKVPNQRFFHINIDIVGPLPSSQGFSYCLTAIDRFSRWPKAMPLADIQALACSL
ncbi:hypothetical protein AVEN_146528-1 [Araneus ventricosus]|uniref:RNA-directed DNA polymerase n=1 Tax=Araneus ventricosus TaxID=182803 RepID=A0A4Y2TP54_ARAVE|nr:hypothetical protein AVEN_146528-1 [Araneus ventricosus]